MLHMGCVAEDASLVKWLLDIGSDIHRSFLGFTQSGDVTETSSAATTRKGSVVTQKPMSMWMFR